MRERRTESSEKLRAETAGHESKMQSEPHAPIVTYLVVCRSLRHWESLSVVNISRTVTIYYKQELFSGSPDLNCSNSYPGCH